MHSNVIIKNISWPHYIDGPPCTYMRTVMPSSHRQHRRDNKTVLSCQLYVNRTGDKSRLSATENFKTALSSLEMQ